MKHIRPYANFTLFAICALLSLSAAISVRGDGPKGEPSKPTPAEPEGHELVGTVEDASAQFSQENLAKLATAKSFEEFYRVLGGLLLRRPVANIVVTAKGTSTTKTTSTDSQGEFKLTGLPDEQYEISAEMPSRFFWTGEKRMARARIPFEFQSSNWVRLKLRTDLVNVKGRIIDFEGRSIAGAKVRGEADVAYLTREREMEFPTRFAVSGNDGSYELRDLVPPDITDIASYITGYNPESDSRNAFYVEICVEADGYIQDTKKATTVPLVTEELLGPARRFLKIMNKLETLIKGSSDKVEKNAIFLPTSHGNTITGIDIVLKKADEGGH